jgi:transposase InsO family protein
MAQAVFDNVVKLHSLPKSIVSDRNKVFTSHVWAELFKLMGINISMSTAYHPQTNG